MDAADGLPADDIANVETLIQAGEWLIAFETLCTQVYEWGVSLPAKIVRELEVLGRVLDADPDYAGHLWEEVNDS